MVTIKKINFGEYSNFSTELLVVAHFNGETFKKGFRYLDESNREKILLALKLDSYKGKEGDYLIVYGSSKVKRVLLYSLGEKGKLTNDLLRAHASKIIRLTNSRKISSLCIDCASFGMSNNKKAQSTIEGLILGSYSFEDYKSKKRKTPRINSITLLGKIDESIVEKGKVLGESVCLARDLGNHPANIMTPTLLSEKCKDIAKANKFKCNIFDVSKFEKMGFGSFYGVARGAKEPAKMIVVEYNGGRKTQKPIALVGKGLTFDSGGISIKPSPKMDEMKFDMCGSATVIGVMNAVSILQPKLNIIFAIGSTENMPGSDAQRPGDIVTAYNGKTIEVLNTDAEGRLVLADVLSYVNKKYKPSIMIDFATLTGAVLVALGNRASGLMGNNNKLINDIKKSAKETGEKVWELPLWPEYTSEIKSPYADLKNIGNGGLAGTITAGAFLKEFVDKTPWCHLDIAGTAWGPKEPAYQPSFGATGVAVRMIYNLIEKKL